MAAKAGQPRSRIAISSAGFTLIELLVVVGIIAILAAIAVPRYNSYKRKSVDAAIESTLNSARIAMEAYYEVNNYTYVGITEADLRQKGYRTSSEFKLEIVQSMVSDQRYGLRGCQNGSNFPSFLYDSNLGVLRPDNTGCP